MKLKLLISLLFCVAITFATDPKYIYIHGKNQSSTKDSVLFCGEISKIDSLVIKDKIAVPEFSSKWYSYNGYKVFSDDFNRIDSDWDTSTLLPSTIGIEWATTNGNTQILNYQLNTKLSGRITYNKAEAVLVANHKFNISADVMLNHPTTATAFVGIAFNIQQDKQSYQLIRFNGAGLVQALSTTNNGTSWTSYHSQSYALPGANFYHLEITSEGTNIVNLKISSLTEDILVDTDIEMSSTIVGGQFGFWNQGDFGRFDNFSLILDATQKVYNTVLTDKRYSKGFSLTSTDESNYALQGKLDYGGLSADYTPEWIMGQWNCINNDLQYANYSLLNRQRTYRVGTVGNMISVDIDNGKLTLENNASTEYGLNGITHNPRLYGEPWPALLCSQRIAAANIVKVSDKNEIRMAMGYKILKVVDKMPAGTTNTLIHTAHYKWSITLQNRNKASTDFSKYLWFILNLHDKRYDFSPFMAAQDGGKENNTGAFMYHPDMKPLMYTLGKAEVGKKFCIDIDILPLLKAAFKLAQERNYLTGSTWDDLYIGVSNMGWEVSGTYDASVEIYNSEIKFL